MNKQNIVNNITNGQKKTFKQKIIDSMLDFLGINEIIETMQDDILSLQDEINKLELLNSTENYKNDIDLVNKIDDMDYYIENNSKDLNSFEKDIDSMNNTIIELMED